MSYVAIGINRDGFGEFFHGFLSVQIHAERHAIDDAQIRDLGMAHYAIFQLLYQVRALFFRERSRIGEHSQQQSLSLRWHHRQRG